MLLLLAIIITAESIETFDNSDINCFIRHLKSLNKLESNYPEYRTRNEIQDCQIGVKKFKIDTYKKITNNDCIQKRLRGENWADYKMKAIVLDLSQHNDEYQRLDELKNVINVKLKEATRYCRLEEEYGELFDVFYNLHEHMDENDKKLVACFEKYSIEYGLIFNYTITSDSHSMNFNCTEIIDEFMITMEENLVENLKQENSQVTQAEIECSLKIYRTEKFIQKIIITVIRGKMSLNETQKLNEKRNFIEFFILITQKVQGCLL
ncbi:hypothetical protein PVAND_005673 [Polypedilum vanderplanki]|uniref:Secreted protein n=1 Tax=Polypedilum vanderplanki TaxID=319348 RepID=A0A9J6C175_POLVA|nr:hypothetical protein PVAND_005673 [Polypedilum vanderplanki]